MTDVRSSNAQRTTLMHYLAQLVETKLPDYANVYDDFPELEETSKHNQKQMEADLNSLKKGLSVIDKEIHNLPDDSRDPFKRTMQHFYEHASTKLESLSKTFQKMLTKFKSLLEYFGEDPNLESDAFLGTVFKFISGFEKAKKDNARKKALEKKAAEMAAKAALAKEKKGAQAGGHMDQLIDSVRTGEAFNKREKGAAINSNALLANEAIEMFSRVNNRRKYAPNGEFQLPEPQTSPRKDAPDNGVNPAQAALATLRASNATVTAPPGEQVTSPVGPPPNFNPRLARKSVGPGVLVAQGKL